MSAPATTPPESGQSAFGAIGDAVRALEADPGTDWSKANITGLRDHLVDMDNVTMRSEVSTAALSNGARFQVTSRDPLVRESIKRMARMHAAMVSRETPYTTTVEGVREGIVMTVTGSTPGDAERIRGLGFFGLLTLGNHHLRHHMALARGEPMNH
jgi:hypothetical protein